MNGKKTIQQKVVFDLEMEHENHVYAKTDNLSKTLDYEDISNFIRTFCSECRFKLKETSSGTFVYRVDWQFRLSTLANHDNA